MAKTTSKLSPQAVKFAQPGAKQYKLSDGQGLYIYIRPSGRKVWYSEYRFDGKLYQLKLGEFPSMTLSQARVRNNELAAQRAKGVNPKIEKERVEKEQARIELERSLTFGQVCKEWLEKRKLDDLADRTIKIYSQLLAYAIEEWNTIPINDIDISAQEKLLLKLASRIPATAEGLASKLFNIGKYCKVRQYTTSNIFDCVQELLPKRPVETRDKHFSAITDLDGFSKLIRAIDKHFETSMVHPFNAAAVQLLAYLPLRITEILSARWDYVDLENATLTIPRNLCKDRQHRQVDMVCYLSEQAIALLKKLHEFKRNEYVFPSSNSKSGHVSNRAILNFLDKISKNNKKQTCHGFRSSFASILAENYPEIPNVQLLVQACLNHSPAGLLGKVAIAYDRSTMERSKRQILQVWADCVDAMRAGRQLPEWQG